MPFAAGKTVNRHILHTYTTNLLNPSTFTENVIIDLKLLCANNFKQFFLQAYDP